MTTASAQQDKDSSKHHVLIIGAGMAGLMAAEELLKDKDIVRVTMVESCSHVGGRVMGSHDDFVKGHVIDLGAEYLHGKDTLLTQLVDRYAPRWNVEPLMEEQFISSYADGGPSPTPTKEGKYGMYYCWGELMTFDDERLHPLERILGTMDEYPNVTEHTSVGDVVEAKVPSNLHNMAVAGYGNTAGCTRLKEISLSMLNHFEDHWEEVEEEGDERLNSRVGMAGIVKELLHDLHQNPGFDLKLDWTVIRIETSNNSVQLVSASNEVIAGDSAVITCPPKYWPHLMDLSVEKATAIQYVGGEKAIKLMLKFNRLLWRKDLQSLICADDLPVPEIWFRDFEDCHLAVGYFTSENAENLLQASAGDEEKMADILLSQLSTVLDLPHSELQSAHVETRVNVWDVGYMFPKVGLLPQHLEELSKPWKNLYFAGEATHTGACCTVQAAMETGVRAALQISKRLK